MTKLAKISPGENTHYTVHTAYKYTKINFDAGKDSEAPVHAHQPKGSPVSHADPDSALSNRENHSNFIESGQPSKRHCAYYQIQFGY